MKRIPRISLLLSSAIVAVLFIIGFTWAVIPAQEPSAYFRVKRIYEASEIKLDTPVSLVFLPSSEALLVLDAQQTSIATLVDIFKDDLANEVGLPFQITDPDNVEVNQETNTLFYFDGDSNQLFQAAINPNDQLIESSELVIDDLASLGIEDAEGVSFDTAENNLLILDAAKSEVVSIAPSTDGTFGADSALKENRVRKTSLNNVVNGNPRDIATNPQNNHIYVLSPNGRRVYELDSTGKKLATYDISSVDLENPQGLTFAPSGDPTDDPEVQNLYIVDTGSPEPQAQSDVQDATPNSTIVELSLVEPVVPYAIQSNLSSNLVNSIDTSLWSPASPDPAGIIYWELHNNLLVSDSEVNEVKIFEGVNVFESSRSGSLQVTHDTVNFSNEPTGLGINPNNGHIFVSDDSGTRMVYEVDLGPDEVMGTGDDFVTEINTETFNSNDPEGTTYGQGILFIIDGVGEQVYKLTPGNNGIFDGDQPLGDDVVTSFDTTSLGVGDPEGIAYNHDSGTLFLLSRPDHLIVETTLDGIPLNQIDIGYLNAVGPAGITYGPGSVNPNINNLYIVARGVDNGADPNENDGMIYEISYEGYQPTLTPTTTPTPTNTSTVTPTPTFGPSPTPSNTPIASDTPTPTPVLTEIAIRVASGSDDAEESDTQSMYLTSSDLELVTTNNYEQVVGMRFNGVQIPRNAIINNAYIQFKADEATSDAASLQIQAHAIDNAPTFISSKGNLSQRPRTSAFVVWNPPIWSSAGEAGPDQQTPNLSAVIQEIVDRQGWVSGNSIALIVTGSGVRVGESFEGDSGGAPLLHVDINLEQATATPTLTPTNTNTPTFTPTPTNTSTSTPTPANTATSTNTPLPTSTSTPTETPTPSDTPTPTNTATNTPTATETATPTATFTATNTPLPTSTPTATSTSTNTPIPTNTRTPTNTSTSTNTPLPTDTPTPTNTSTNTPTATNTSPPTNTPIASDTPTPTPVLTEIAIRVASGSDDAEESDTQSMYLTSSDLELVTTNNYEQVVGMRFNGVQIPRNAIINNAYIQFKADEATSDAASLQIQAHAIDNAPTFISSKGNLSQRPRTSAFVVWNPPIWSSAGEAGPDQQTPNLSAVIQEIVDRQGWVSGNSIALIVTGSGVRVGESFEGDSGGAPLLHVDINLEQATATPTLTPTNTNTPTFTPTPTNTSTSTPTPANTATSTNTPLPTSTSTPTETPTPSDTPTPTNTATNTPTATETATPTATFTATNTPLPTSTPTPTNTPTPTLTPTNTPTPRPIAFYLSLSSSRTYPVGSVPAVSDEDIISFNGNDYSMVFDGSDVGVQANDIDAFYFINSSTILISFDKVITLDGLGQVEESDILQFNATSLGDVTSGSWVMYFDGSDVGMDAPGEDIDAFFLRPDGSLLLSTNGNSSVPGASGKDEDLLLFTPTTLGDITVGTWLLYFDGSDVGIGDDVDGIDVSAEGELFLSTRGSISIAGLNVDDEDIFTCIPSSFGTNTVCEVQLGLYFDGSLWGISGHDIDSFTIE